MTADVLPSDTQTVETVEAALDLRAANARALGADLDWLEAVVAARLARRRGTPGPTLDELPPPPPAPASRWAGFLAHYEMDAYDRLLVLLALAPHVRPEALDGLFAKDPATGRGPADVGGIQGTHHGGFLPTAETALFLLAEGDLGVRFALQARLGPDYVLAQHDLVRVEAPPPGEPAASGALRVGDDLVALLTQGAPRPPAFGAAFPARLLTSSMDWDDLVLAPATREHLAELEAWLQHGAELASWGIGRHLAPGYRCLFYGPPGTGKTLAATLLGRRVGLDVYRVDLSAVVSKYIGETEQNLERVFARAEALGCVLFFDEADALFGKRTAVSDAHDRYANQEVSYLLQRVESFPGLVVLATNLKQNLDEAFLRRFQAVVPFTRPGPAERERLWAQALAPPAVLADDVDLGALAGRHELSGADLVAVARHASLAALARGERTIRQADLVAGLRRELQKAGKTL